MAFFHYQLVGSCQFNKDILLPASKSLPSQFNKIITNYILGKYINLPYLQTHKVLPKFDKVLPHSLMALFEVC